MKIIRQYPNIIHNKQFSNRCFKIIFEKSVVTMLSCIIRKKTVKLSCHRNQIKRTIIANVKKQLTKAYKIKWIIYNKHFTHKDILKTIEYLNNYCD